MIMARSVLELLYSQTMNSFKAGSPAFILALSSKLLQLFNAIAFIS
jgi:hypothetical protein